MFNPYKIEGPANIGYSGGRTSAYLLKKIVEAHDGVLPTDVHIGFCNTGKEREETLVFVEECAKRFGVHITWLEWCRVYGQDKDAPWYKIVDFETASRNGEPFDMMMDYYAEFRRVEKNEGPMMPSFANHACTAYLKIKVAEKWMRSLGYDHWDAILGIRTDEPIRYHKMMRANEIGGQRWENVCPLYSQNVTQEVVQEFWKKQPFDLGIDSSLGNCDLCWKKSEANLVKTMMNEPDRAAWWIEKERQTGQVFRRDIPSFKALLWTSQQMKKQTSFDFSCMSTQSYECSFCGD